MLMSGLEVLCNVRYESEAWVWERLDSSGHTAEEASPLHLLTWQREQEIPPLQDWVTRGYTQVRPGVEEQS